MAGEGVCCVPPLSLCCVLFCVCKKMFVKFSFILSNGSCEWTGPIFYTKKKKKENNKNFMWTMRSRSMIKDAMMTTIIAFRFLWFFLLCEEVLLLKIFVKWIFGASSNSNILAEKAGSNTAKGLGMVNDYRPLLLNAYDGLLMGKLLRWHTHIFEL